jgi:plastocyanin
MKKTILLAAPLGLVLFYGTSQVTAQDDECESMTIPVCQDGTRITINNNGKMVAPPNLCVDPGETITVSVSPDGTSASIEGKNGGWPSGSGSSFTLVAPESGTYDYNVYFSDGSCLDPRIEVKD